MLNIFKEKCPVCKMKFEKRKEYPAKYGKKFCSENCQEEFGKKIAKEQSSPSKGCCD